MFSRLLWRVVTPRQIRRASLLVLLAWFAVALAYQNGFLPQPDTDQLPLQVDSAGV